MIRKSSFVVGVLGAIIAGPVGAEEFIEVTSCNADETQFGEGAGMVCVANDWLDGSMIPDDDFDGPADEYSKGGHKPKTKTKPNRPVVAHPSPEVKHKAKCAACKTAFNKCMDGARSEEKRCEANAREKATWRCNINAQQGPGKTPWGCNTNQLYEGLCNTAEPPWNDRDKWEPGGASTQYYCEASWAVAHPSGSTTTTDTLDLSVLFKGVGASNSTTVNSTYELHGKDGWQTSCTTAGDKLMVGCDDAATKCFDENDCTAAER